MKDLKQIVIISGKGGTGKTTVTASLADLMPQKVIVDADAANLFILLKPLSLIEQNFQGRPIACIDQKICTTCGTCSELCRFNAIKKISDTYYVIDEISCEGCGLCQTCCPVNAIEMVDQNAGKWFVSKTEYGDFIYARLVPGAENSGLLVSKVRQQATKLAKEKNLNTILIDGPPGIGCPVIASISGTNYAIIVTEPTLSAISDLTRIHKLINHFQIPGGIVINKYDINLRNTAKIEEYGSVNDLPVLGKIPHSFCIIDAITKRDNPFKKCPELESEIIKIYKTIQRRIS